MKRKYVILLLILLLIIIAVVILFKSKLIQVEVENNTTNTQTEEVVPEEEITDEQLRTSKVKLYFKGEDGDLKEETRDVDVKELIKDPYKIIINLLIEGPQIESNKKLIPEDTKLLGTERVGDVLTINFSKEFIDNCEKDFEKQELLVKSILYTVMELREIESIKIIIEGQEVDVFMEDGYNLSDNISL